MAQQPSEAIKLFGTEEPAPAARVLRAGPLTAEFDAGNLRHIRFHGLEVLRAISYIVRDRDWGTYNPTIDALKIDETAGGFTVSYEATAADDKQVFRYRAHIEATADGKLTFSGSGEAVSDFLTNRTGFVVLHAIDGVAGHPVEIEHVDGRLVKGRFPELIDPVQPMKDIRSLTHEAAPGLRVTCRMEGDTFEMEDQRNWTDASYKTYVRPLALPWPYQLPAGTKISQSIFLLVNGRAPAKRDGDSGVELEFGKPAGPAPHLGLGLDPSDLATTKAHASTLATLKPHHLVCHYDPRRGHTRETLREMVAIASSLGAKAWLEAIIVGVETYADEVRSLALLAKDLGSPFEIVLLSPASDLKCTLPGSVWPPAPPAEEMFRLAREVFPKAKLGGGMFSFFTELNRKRPPLAVLDLVSFTTSALVHAGDDVSVMEGLESLPAIASSAQAIAGHLPLHVGPSAIGMRMNPYGAAPMENPRNIRQAMNRNDPRQRGLLGLAWTMGYYAHFARAGFAAISFGGTTGPFGVLASKEPWPQPWYEENGGLYPLYHGLRGLAGLGGRPMLLLNVSEPSRVQGVAVEGPEGRDLWLANLTNTAQKIHLPAEPSGIAVIDASRFVEASKTQDLATRLSKERSRTLTLEAFALAHVRFP